MALPILDGNQTSTTLATTVSGGAHYPNHILASGTVTANLGGLAYQSVNDGINSYVGDYGTFPISGTVTANSGNVLGDSIPSGTHVYPIAYGAGMGGLQIPSSEFGFGLPVDVNGGTVTVGSCVTHGVTISNSSVTVNGTFWQSTQPVSLASVPTHGVTLASTTVTVSSLPSISGTVTVGSCVTHGVTIANSSVTIGGSVSISGTPSVTFGAVTGSVNLIGTPSVTMGAISGTVTANINGTVPVSGTFYQATQPVSLAIVPTHGVTLASTTVTVSSFPRVTFIDGSSSVVTANSAIQIFATSSTRSYLLVQVTTGSAYVNVGDTATTANGIYLGTGQGYAWETTIPQGIVSLISTVTGTEYCAKQA